MRQTEAIIVQVRQLRPAQRAVYILLAIWLLVLLPLSVVAAPYADYVVDARTGEVLHSDNANTRLHPASLTKMMTLYIAFEAIKNGEITLDTKVKISRNAAAEPPSKLGLKSGQTIALRYLIRAAAIKSANDAATAIGEAIAGSEAAFARRMNRTAKALGMTRTTFKNAHGLTAEGHLSTAHDMTILGRHVLYDYPQYYNLFSRRTAETTVRTVSNTNRRLLDAYRGADGIKTGYTRAAGFNLVASAQRGDERIIATVFGGQSTQSRNARVAELLDLGFRRAPSRAPVRKPDAPDYVATTSTTTGTAGKTIRLVGAVQKSLRPRIREASPIVVAESIVETAREDSSRLQADIAAAMAGIRPTDAGNATEVMAAVPQEAVIKGTTEAPAIAPRPEARPRATASKPAEPPQDVVLAKADAAADRPAEEAGQEIVTRLSTSGGRQWGINIGRYGSRYEAEKMLLRMALSEMTTLDGTLRKVVQSPRGFDANFHGMTRETADLACRRLQARNISCFMIGPG
ncbi:D-alanyl-D-alanine carboxypeptidase family protein [Arenibacterium halophilum]|uniref:D-alanyl-D-alanine carboxypeptidase n=1 Tax=Arenibacterium halophilum TaxID=2583821 RepID=A0ABY2X8M5_9RHOB|nr:D-alanyl-D-alanine carboxypeptidase family protein [Arenibacterium halophilum]TMV11808.1 D-alanyl-D-alanine carboxypeptidase [Arenibacterium halophilum]